ncbi:MAG: c-type cytochrome [Alphaproteobacteria bacterium]|nr:c-type cytochrome [Alphaproteobacteria bacterium]
MSPSVHAADPNGSGAAGAEAQFDQALVASIAAGGRLYDNWMRELADRKPGEMHVLYPPEGDKAGVPDETWRCVTCHGWDYKGVDGAFESGPDYTGIKGITRVRGMKPDDITPLFTDEKHDFGNRLDKQSIADLSNFLAYGMTPVDMFIDPVTRRVKIEPVSASPHFSTICVNCHGADGRMMATIPPLGDVARADPWQSMHKMLNGHPGDAMPALRAFDMITTLGTLSFIQSLPSRDQLFAIARGGKLYDNWIDELDIPEPKDVHPAFPKKDSVREGSNTWRCVECHGWDYKGAHGIKGIDSKSGAHPAAIMKILSDDTHALGTYLKYEDLYDLASFVSFGQIEMREYIDPQTNKAHGNAENSERYYLTLCATCHGEDGRAIRTMPPVGRVANERPQQALHKVLHGHPGDAMPAWQASMPPLIIKDMLAKLQTLPQRK